MPAPTVDYKILVNGYEVSGDVRSGYRARVPYLVAWKDAFKFIDDIFAGTTTTISIVGPVKWNMPYRFPASNLNMYAQAFSMRPSGAGGEDISSITRGLAPGEFFTHAVVTVDFSTPNEIQSSSQDPGNLNQLDPNNPLTMCEQSIQIASKMIQTSPGAFRYSSSGNSVNQPIGILTTECKLVLTFPRIPYLPWKFMQPYVNTVNDSPIFNCVRGSLLLAGMDTKVSPNKGQLSQQVQLQLHYNTFGDWNTLIAPGNVFDTIYRMGGPDDDTNRVYPYKDFSKIFSGISYDVVSSEPPMAGF